MQIDSRTTISSLIFLNSHLRYYWGHPDAIIFIILYSVFHNTMIIFFPLLTLIDFTIDKTLEIHLDRRYLYTCERSDGEGRLSSISSSQHNVAKPYLQSRTTWY